VIILIVWGTPKMLRFIGKYINILLLHINYWKQTITLPRPLSFIGATTPLAAKRFCFQNVFKQMAHLFFYDQQARNWWVSCF